MPTKASGHWKNLKQRAADGDYDLVDPLDYLLLEILPEEGELVMNFYPYAKNVEQLVKERFDGFSPGQMSGILKRLTLQDLCVRTRTSGTRSFGYQRTSTGKKVYEEWRKKNPSTKAPEGNSGAQK